MRAMQGKLCRGSLGVVPDKIRSWRSNSSAPGLYYVRESIAWIMG